MRKASKESLNELGRVEIGNPGMGVSKSWRALRVYTIFSYYYNKSFLGLQAGDVVGRYVRKY